MRPCSKTIRLFLLLLLAMLAACSKPAPGPSQAAPAPTNATMEAPAPQSPAPTAEIQATPRSETAPTRTSEAQKAPFLECDAVDPSLDRADCFKLQPGKASKNKHGKTVTGRCQPQCVPYARCRSGIMTCRLGDTGPVEWFECARKSKATTLVPKAGSIMVIDVNNRRKMPTGHLGYVEEACPNADGTWSLRFSHTNFDRKCHLDLDAKVLFNPATMTATFLSGPWKTWAKDLKIRGFILR
ncbi:hypothetical protein H4684_001686 [Desulfomicrobium macestii]|uniref:Peptidase C51 domain-containing protein n=1 Tax=Desulfomicrobium macestii TaxID=90731 RepID=A0ABR9H3D4_9BACT|nr:CHAP domain-containing protein [Desulfomicrobium macestii]MBE1425042.1 hypothetical protein [Desulfomicrobium macestii]